MMFQFGLDRAHANRSATLESEKGSPTSGICGQSSSDSLKPVSLQQSLANRLRARMDVNGSPEYSLTWKEWDIAGQEPICALRASARRTSDNDCSGWPTPDTQAFGVSDSRWEKRRAEIKAKGINGNGFGLTLGMAATLTGWPTPMAGSPATENYNEAGNTDFSRKCVSLVTGWNTPQATDGSNGGPNQAGGALPADAAIAGWATPAARDHKSGETASGEPLTYNARPLSEQCLGAITSSCPAATENRGALNPELSRWLMGYPAEWGCYGATAMRSSRKSRRNSSKRI
jgi:hypothetical protein